MKKTENTPAGHSD